jgi:hypothetical protein
MKREVSVKFKKEKTNAGFLERNTEVDRMTIRSLAAKTIEKISGNHSILTIIREIQRGGIFLIEESTGALLELWRKLGGKVGTSLIFEYVSY